ncbi:DUF5050 domain-containing protein [Anaeromicropila populeti]|uniref:Prolow-density lipoprotein receptor-related protein 1-like beta-propeller domain-containing protein n=1 Tax=Anaeromicropila populeti TaxID=37658 RepID=A0A1I6KS49_9FIRM|nr:DUF5050 domain-containing protein [Anaeromicropila populeti]SFR94055.1 protein of unknown function [Anaeromicropila populeti]
MKKKIPFIVVLLAIIGFIIYTNLTYRIEYNQDSALGNTSGNLLNTGLFCEDDNKIYFANHLDNDSLYVMDTDCTNFKKIYSNTVSYINAEGKYIFYNRENRKTESQVKSIFAVNTVGLYRIIKSGKQLTSLYEGHVLSASLLGNYIYYDHYDDKTGLSLHRIKLDQTDDTRLISQSITPNGFSGSDLYYCGTENDHYIYKMNQETLATDIVYKGNCGSLLVQDRYIYYLNLDEDYHIWRIQTDGTNEMEVVDEGCSTYNISLSGKYLYYQVDAGGNSRFCRMNLETGESETILAGIFTSIHVTSNYIFFREYDTNKTFMIPAGDSNEVSVFEPPVLN